MANAQQLYYPFSSSEEGYRSPFVFRPDLIGRPPVDEWELKPGMNQVFFSTKGAIIMDVSSYYHLPEPNPDLDAFSLEAKRAYNGDVVRGHITKYLNYFETYYDYDHELPAIYASMKYLIDYEPAYGKDALFFDLSRYFINRHSPIFIKLMQMNEDNYCLELTYRNKKNPVLQYRNRHAKLLMMISVLMNMIIIPACHFMKVRKIKKPNEFLMEIFDRLLLIDPNIDIFSKLSETASSSVKQSEQKNQEIFNRQDIRGLNSTIHAQNSVANILINIIPKYKYSENIINLNFRSILNNTGLTRGPTWLRGQVKNPSNCWNRLKISYTTTWYPKTESAYSHGCEREGSKKIRGTSEMMSRSNQQLSYKLRREDWQLEPSCSLIVICRYGGIGRHARFKLLCLWCV